MNLFQQFDISDFLNEIQEPLFLMDSEEIIFLNQFFHQNFTFRLDSWIGYFDQPELIAELVEYFESGKLPQSRFVKPLVSLEGRNVQFEWRFIKLPSSYNSRFLIAIGTQFKVSLMKQPNLIFDREGSSKFGLGNNQSILNQSHELIAILDKSGNFKFISDSVTDKLGFAPSDIIGKNFRDLSSEGKLELVKGDLSDILNTQEEISIGFWVRLNSGKRIYLESFAINLLDHPQIQGIIFRSGDIAQSIQTEEPRLEVFDLRKDLSNKRATESYLKLQSQILTQVNNPILVTNLDLKVIYLNEAAVQLCCPETARDFDGYFGDLVNVHWEKNELLELITSALNLGEVWKSERYIQTKHTHYSPFEISIQAIQGEGKEKIGYSFVLRDLNVKYPSDQLANRAQLIVENSPAVLFRVDPNENFKIQYISENIRRFGYDAAYLIQNDVSFLDLLHPDDAENILQNAIKKTSPEGVQAFSGEYRIKTASGNFIWVEDRTRDVTSESGKIIIHEGLFQDISDRKNLEEIQSMRDKRYRVLAANIHGTNIFLLDANRTYILAEGTNFENWGLNKEDFEGKRFEEGPLTPHNEISAKLERVYTDLEIIETEFLFNGRYYHQTIRPIVEGGKVEYALSIIRDIQEEYQAKLDLQQSEQKFRRLVEESTEIIFSLTETFMLHYVSPNVKQFLGYDSDEVTGRSIFDFLNPDDLGGIQEILGKSTNFLAQNQFLEFRLRHKNGEYRVFNSNGKLIEDKNGIHRYYTGVARDISKLKETQRELLIAKERAEQASQIKSQFLSVMSHEIRTPMNAVIGLANFLMEDNPRPDQLENLKTLQFSAENLMALINDILDYNKIESGKVELERFPFDLRNVVNRIVHTQSFQSSDKSLKISCEIDEEIPQTLIGDPLRLGQIVNNLVSNAIKFTEKGFVRISLSKEFTQGNLTDIRFVFEDTGIGIPESKRKTIFEAFTQASSSTSRKYGGTGLGLAIVKRLVELSGGEIEVKARKGGGSVFEFTLPFEFIDTETFEAVQAGLFKDQQKFEKASILVAEDNTVNQILIRKFLTKWNAGNLVIASDGLEALKQFNLEHFDLVLLDLQMPEMDGFEVANAIRRHSDLVKRKVPILALTAASLNEVKEEMRINGIDDFIPKPFSPERLFEKILEHLDPEDRLD